MSYDLEEFSQNLELAVRRVQTPEGAKKFGQPIGTIITADMIKALQDKQSHGSVTSKGTSGKDTSSGVPSEIADKGTSKETFGDSNESPKDSAKDDPKMSPEENYGTSDKVNGLTLKSDPLPGPHTFKVGESTFNAPVGSKVIRPKKQKDIAYVQTSDGTVHAFNPSGEHEIPEYLESLLSEKFSSLKDDDAEYSVETFDGANLPSLKDQTQGATLFIGGEPAFTKTGENAWEHPILGITLTDDDLQPQVDSGKFELKSSETQAETDFSKMTKDEIQAVLDSYPEGQKVKFSPGNAEFYLQKQKNGNWIKDTDSQKGYEGLPSDQLADSVEHTNWLSEVPFEENAPEPDLVEQEALQASETTEDDKLSKKAQQYSADSAFILGDALPGDIVFHRTHGMLVKKNDPSWQDKNGVNLPSDLVSTAATSENLSFLPWNEEQQKTLSEYTPEESQKDDPAQKESVPFPAEAVEVFDLSDAVSGDKIYVSDSGEVGKHSTEFTLQDGGTWTAPGWSVSFTTEDLQVDLDEGYVYQIPKESPKPEIDEPEIDEPEAVETDQDSTEGLTDEDKQSAVEALESHSGFQIKYGLKSLPDSHPLKDDDTLAAEVESAKKVHPGLSPKQALISYLKGENPVEPLATWEKELLNENSIQIGSDSPKKVVQGMTGGVFTPKEIQEAVDLLESYDGKVFKAHLVKNGSPLGELSPNDIIGFEKDKLIGKQKFIDFLKGKLEGQEQDNDTDVAPEFSPETFDFKTATTEDVESIPVGTVAYFNANDKGIHYTKKAPGQWGGGGSDFAVTDADMKQTFNKDEGWEFTPYSAPESELTPEEKFEQGLISFKVYKAYKDKEPAKKYSKGDAIPSYMDFQKLENSHALISDPASKKIGGQAGSNEGGLYELETPDGVKKFYVKKAQTEDHGKNEALANALYQELGVNAPNVDFASDGNIYSEIVDGDQNMQAQLNYKNKAWIEKLQKDFAIDAWLSNRDVFGMTYDNILTDGKGDPWRIDNGGALKYRAQGQKKTDFEADDVPELEVFKTGKKSVIFGEGAMSKEQELDGVNRLAKLSPERIDELVAESGMDSEMADILKGRREYILNKYGVEDPYAEAPKVDSFDPDTVEEGYVFKSVAELDALNSGQKINVSGIDLNWEKNENGTFDEPQSQVSNIPASNFQTAINSGSLTYVVDKPVFEDLDAADPEFTTLEKWQNDPVGTEYKSTDGHFKYKKTTAGGAGIVSDANGESGEMSPGDFKTAIKNQFLKNVDSNEYVNGIAPGKYNTGKGAKAHLYVKPDGTGIYVGMKGIKKELDAEGVKKNYDAGMNVFSQFVAEGDFPGLSDDVAETKAPKVSKIIPTLGDVSTLPDGTYEGPMGVKYTVSGDSVIASKAVKSMDFTSIKVNQVPDKNFLADAPTGTQIAFRYSKGDSPEILTKNEDGEWKGSTYGESYLYAVENYYAWAHKKWKVHSFPGTDDSKVTKASLKTKYLQGQLVNPETKSSVFPIGYSGSVTFFDGPTDIASLASYRDYLKDSDIPVGDKGYAHNTYGVPMNVNLIKEYIHKKHGVEASSGQEQLDYIIEELDEFLATAKVPEAQDFSQVFQKDEFDAVPKPLEAVTASKPSWYDGTGVWTAHIKTLSATIGDGSLIGANMAGAKKDDKTDWVSYFNNGDFDKMYQLELAVAKSKGKTHPTGNAHPGHPDNKATHKIKWSAAVKGEVPAGTDVPGNWSSLNVDASLAELDNYLILAKMQNPTHLSNHEKRTWVSSHRNGQKSTVDALSAQAALRAKNNEPPITEAPQWTDDVKPAKTYDSMFDDTEFPQTWNQWPNQNKAQDFYEDHYDKEPELESLYKKFSDENPYGYPAAEAVQAFFAAKEEAYLEELNKPVWEVKKTISEGSHPTFIVKDQKSEKMKIFKPTTTGKEWRADNEVAAHNLGAMLGFNVPGAVIGDVNEGIPMGSNNKGIVMDFAPNVGSLGNVDGAEVDLKTLTPTQFGQLAKEHVFDWFLDNDDTHDENMLIGTDGNLVAIDKGRAFAQYGHWHGLDVDNPESLNINTKDSPGRKSVVYADMINAVKNGQISQEQLDEAYKQALKAAKRVQKSDDNTIAAFVRSASDQRDNWDLPSYAEKWNFLTPHPTNQDELVAAVLSRKNSMIEDFEEFYDKLYKAAGFFKPEPPAKALGEEHLSGWEEADVLSKTEEAKVWGAAPIHGSAAFADGASLLWTEKDTNGNSVISGKIKLGNITQQKVMDFMASKVSPYSGVQSTSTLNDYPQAHVKQWKKTVTAVGKDLSNNATTGDYNDALWFEMKQVEDKVNADLEYAETVDISDGGTATFPSGVSMPTETVPMYVMALNYHKGLIANVEKAKANKEATDKTHFQDFNPPAWKTKGMKYISPEGWTYKELDDGNYVEVKNGVASVVPDAPDSAKSGAPGWTVEKPDGKADTSAEKYSLIQAGMFAGQLNADGEKIMKSDFNTSGHPGKEYRIDLPTGEKIFFRDGDQTGTVRSQTGTVRFQLNRMIDSESSLANVQSYLQTVGLDMRGADEEQAENVYWRQMFGRIIGSDPTGAPASVKKVREKLINMRSGLTSKLGKSFDDLDIPEAIGLTEKDERTFWHDRAVEAWGAETVNDFLAQGRHMPKYQHMDLNDPEKATGLPWFQRIDVDLDKLYAKGTMLAHGNNGKDKRHFDYIKSGAYTSTEERLRILGFYKTGASSSSDQGTGGANYVFTRVAHGQALKNGSIYGSHVMYWSPEVMSMTGTYSYSSDQFGNLSYLQNHNQIDPLKSLEYSSGGNETMIPNNVSLLDFMEIMVFESENERLKAIEEFKKKGIEQLRGLPIEDRLVLRKNLDSALAKIKKAWKK